MPPSLAAFALRSAATRTVRRTALAAILMVCASAFAQQIPSDIVPARGKAPEGFQVPAPGAVKPVEQPLFHNWTAGFEQSYYHTSSKDPALPGSARFHDSALTVSSRIGERGFAGLQLGYSTQSIDSLVSADLPIAIRGDTHATSWAATAGYDVLPWLNVGVLYGHNSPSGSYQLQIAVPPNQTSGSGDLYSVYTNAFVPYRDWVFNLGLAYTHSRQNQSYTDNFPPDQTSSFDIFSTTLGAAYALGHGFTIGGYLTNNARVNETAYAGETGLDSNWTTASLGLNYRINQKWDAGISGATWRSNSKTNYNRINLKVSYHF